MVKRKSEFFLFFVDFFIAFYRNFRGKSYFCNNTQSIQHVAEDVVEALDNWESGCSSSVTIL